MESPGESGQVELAKSLRHLRPCPDVSRIDILNERASEFSQRRPGRDSSTERTLCPDEPFDRMTPSTRRTNDRLTERTSFKSRGHIVLSSDDGLAGADREYLLFPFFSLRSFFRSHDGL